MDQRSITRIAHDLTVQRFGKTIQMYAPLYLSNECIDTCLYCGFSRKNKIVRKTLTVEEVLDEADLLIKEGFQHLLLVSGEHPKKVSPDYLITIVKKLKEKTSFLSIEVAPFDFKTYQKLNEAGVDGVVIYQETYNREIYKKVHQGGPKQNFDRRLQAVEDVCRAGIRMIGMGVLLGLSDWREDVSKLIQHVHTLRKRFWKTEITVSLPRLKPCASGFQALYPVCDEDFTKIVQWIRLKLPEVGINLSTRESPNLRDRLVSLGITHMSAGSKTEPGGYSKPKSAGEQFILEDLRKPKEVAKAIQAAGYEPVWKDWI